MSQKKQSENATSRTTKKSKKVNKKKVFLIFITIMVLLSFIVGGAVVGIVVGIIKDADPIDATNIYDLLDESSFILDSEGQVLEKVQTTDYRSITDYSKMPPHLIDAFVAIEDERFWNHSGLDIRRIFGVLWINLRTGSRQGASTINQQLAKNLYLTHEQTITRKIQDMYYGIQLDRQLSKEQILEAYLNTIYLGSSAYGVQAASQVYFSKDVSELTIAEAALIAGITRNPSRYSPIRTLEKHQINEDTHYVLNDSDSIYTIVFNESTIPRQRLVLSIMRRLEMITESEYQAALEEDIKANLKPNRLTADAFTSYFGDLVKDDVIKAFVKKGYSREEAVNTLYSGGLRIYSTMDTNFQRILDEEFEKQSNFVDLQGRPLLTVGDDGNVQPQAAMVVMEPTTGEIKALIGGRGISGRKIYNRALNPRQPGSSIKPIAVYTPALDLGFTAATVIDDIPVYFDRGNSTRRYPSNHNNRYNGLIPMREAIRDSSNVGTVVTIYELANNNDSRAFNIMFDYMEKMGISTVVRPENPYVAPNGRRSSDATYSTALGGMTHGVSPLEMTSAFASLANEGVYTEPITFTKITDRRGNLILENNSEKHRVVSSEAAYILTDMLRTAVTSGTGSPARFDQGNSRIPVAGKTGTTTNNKDAWFVGYTPYYVGATWVGYDTPDKLPGGGGRMAGTVWKNVMQRIHQELSPKNFEEPSNIVRVNVCNVSGKLPTQHCSLDPRGSRVRSEVFVRGTEPKEYCDVHVVAEVHAPTGKLATEHTPPWEIESRVFISRPVPYYPEAHGGIVPTDYGYTLPRRHYDPLEDGGSSPPFLDDSTDGLIDDDGWLNDSLEPDTTSPYDYDDLIDDNTVIDSVIN